MASTPRQLILASQSPQRQAILATLGIPFEVVPADLDEKAIQDVDPLKRAEKLALAKATAVQAQFPEAVVVAGDTFVVFNDQTLEKPVDLDEAKQMLTLVSGKEVVVVTGVAFLDPSHQIQHVQAVTNQAVFRPLDPLEVERYVTTQPVLTWSGAFSPAYLEGMALFAEVKNGSFTAFTHGLPLELVAKWLRESLVLS